MSRHALWCTVIMTEIQSHQSQQTVDNWSTMPPLELRTLECPGNDTYTHRGVSQTSGKFSLSLCSNHYLPLASSSACMPCLGCPRVLLLYYSKVSSLFLLQVIVSYCHAHSACLRHIPLLTVNLHPFFCFYLALCPALVLSGSSSLFSLAPPWLSSPWFLVLTGLSWPPAAWLASPGSLSPLVWLILQPLPLAKGCKCWGKGQGKGYEKGREVGYGVCLCLSLQVNVYLAPYSCAHGTYGL